MQLLHSEVTGLTREDFKETEPRSKRVRSKMELSEAVALRCKLYWQANLAVASSSNDRHGGNSAMAF